MKKRIISLLMAFIMVCSCCFVATTAQADAAVDSTLTLDASSSTAKKLVFMGTDSININSSVKKFKANATDEGVFINSVKDDTRAFTKRNGTWILNLSENAVADTVVTVKGTFTYSTDSVRFATITVKYNGSTWEVIDNPAEGASQVTLTGTDGWNTAVDGDNWVLYLTTNGYSSTDWSKKYAGFTYEIDGVTGTTSQVSSCENNRLYCSIPTSAVPTTDGTTFTIKAGTYAAEDGTNDNLNIAEDFQVVVSEGRLIHAKVIEAATVEPFDHSAASFYFSLKDANGNAITTGYESWTNFLSPAWCDGTRITQDTVPNQWSTVYSGVFVDGNPMNYWDAHFKNPDPGVFYIDGLNAVAGTTITVKGYFASSTQAAWTIVGNYFLKEISFTYDGTVWQYNQPAKSDEVTLTSTHGWATCVDGDNWVLYMNTSGYTSNDWSKKYQGFTYEINGVTGTTSQVSSTEDNRLYCTIPTSEVSTEEGTVFTIKAGTYAAEAGTSDNLVITNDFYVVVSEGRLLHTTVIDAATAEVGTGSNVSELYFTLKDSQGNAINTGCASDGNFLSPAWCDVTRIDPSASGNNIWSTVYSGVFVNGAPINYWNAYFKQNTDGQYYVQLGDFSVTAGTTVTVKGHFAASTTADWTIVGNYFLQKLTFTYDGSAWTYDETTDDNPTYTEHQGTPVFWQSNGANGFYFSAGETAFPYDAANWTVTAFAEDTEESGVFINGSKTAVYVKKVNEDLWYVCVGDASITPATGDILTVKGAFVHETHRITFVETQFVWDGSAWTPKEEEIVVDEDNIVFSLDRAEQGGGTVNGIYLIATDSVPYDVNWATNTTACAGKENGVFLNGVKTDVFLKKYNENQYYVCLSDVNVVPQEGDTVTVKGAFKTGDFVSSYVEYSVSYKNGSWVDGTEPETQYTTVTITDYDTNVSKYNEALERWEFYFATKEELPGVADQRFETVLVNINGKEYYIPCYHGSHRDNFFLIIEKDKLPKIVGDEEFTVTISGKAKSADQLLGMDVQKFTLYMNKYGQSLTGFPEPIKVKETKVKLTLDKTTFGWMAGSEAGIYLFTDDNFAVDETWRTPIRAVAYDDNSGIFLNGKKIDAYLKKHAEGMIYLDVASSGIFAKDKDVVTIKGTFALGEYGVSYAEQTFYYNGQSWETSYKEPIKKTTTTLKPIGIVKPSSFNPERKAWDIYVQVDGAIPGGHDYEYKTFIYEVNGETYETSVYRVDDKLVFFVPETIVPQDAKDGTAITLKAGTASDNYGIYDINLAKDCTAYVYRKAISGIKPTEKTPYLDVTIPGLLRTWTFNEDIKEWQLFFIVEEDFDVEDGTQYYDLPVKLNGKSYEEINVFRSGECLYISIPESVLPRDAKSASLTIGKDAKAVANAGWNGIRLKNEVKAYMFDGVWNNIEFKDAEVTDLTIKHMNFCSYNSDVSRWDIYVNVNKELPGTAWFEYYDGLTAYLNGKKYTTYANKAESENNRLLYISLSEEVFGKFKDGDILYIPGDVTWSCGGYKINNTHDFYLQYVNGTWFEYYESDVKAPEALNSIWEKFRIEGYIPVQEEKGIMFANVAPNNVMKSIEDMKDVTFTFETTKMMAMNEELPTNSFVLRGQPLSEDMDISETALYGYNISFSYIELTESNMPNNPELWGTHSQEIAVWKNGINYNLLDQYRMTYNWQKTDHPFFEYNETYKYTVSIYNVAEDICVIEVYCNDELIMCVVDHASDDPKDPARNAGEFQIYAACPQYFYAPAVELDTLEVSASECYIGEQVRVSATYPAILEGAEYTVDGEDATIKDGVFIAKKAGTYTVSGKFNGKDKGTVQIKVTEKPQEDVAVEETSTFPIIPVAITGGSVLIVAAILLVLFLKKRKRIAKEA